MTTAQKLQASPPPLSLVGTARAGARLRAAREAAGLSLDQIAQQLKLAPRQVQALEEENFAQLPGRTFARGFVRNYARLLNLDAEDLLALLPDAARDPALEAPALQSTAAMIAELPSASAAQAGFTRWVIPLVLVACIVVAAAYEWYVGGLAPQHEAPDTALPALAASTPAAASSTEPPNMLAAEAKPAAPAAAPAASENSVAVAAAPPASAAPLQLRFAGPSWVEIRDRDGKVLVFHLFVAGNEESLRGSAPFDLVIGNASEVALIYRGAPVDLSRYTQQNVARLRLDR